MELGKRRREISGSLKAEGTLSEVEIMQRKNSAEFPIDPNKSPQPHPILTTQNQLPFPPEFHFAFIPASSEKIRNSKPSRKVLHAQKLLKSFFLRSSAFDAIKIDFESLTCSSARRISSPTNDSCEKKTFHREFLKCI
jgi:hypothetical protein